MNRWFFVILACLFLFNGVAGFAEDESKETRLHKAIAYPGGSLDAVKAIISSGEMNVNSKLVGELDRPLNTAIVATKPDIVTYLLENGADVNFAGAQGVTPIMNAVGHMPIEIIKMMLEKGAKLDAANNDKMTPLHWAAYRGNVAAIELFLEKGANINAVSENVMGLGGTPLHNGAKSPEVVKLLVAKGLSVNAQNEKGFTPLMIASRGGAVEAVKTLLELKADANLKNNEGKKAHQIAKEMYDSKDKYLKDKANPSAEMKNLQAVIDLLVKAGATD